MLLSMRCAGFPCPSSRQAAVSQIQPLGDGRRSGHPPGGGRTAQRRRSHLPRLAAPLRQDLRAGRPRIRQRSTCPSGISTMICSPGRHSRSSSSTTAGMRHPRRRLYALTRQPWCRSTDRLSDGTAVHATPCGRRIVRLAPGVAPRHLSPRIEILLVVLLVVLPVLTGPGSAVITASGATTGSRGCRPRLIHGGCPRASHSLAGQPTQ
jgi:hypothetical protein